MSARPFGCLRLASASFTAVKFQFKRCRLRTLSRRRRLYCCYALARQDRGAAELLEVLEFLALKQAPQHCFPVAAILDERKV